MSAVVGVSMDKHQQLWASTAVGVGIEVGVSSGGRQSVGVSCGGQAAVGTRVDGCEQWWGMSSGGCEKRCAGAGVSVSNWKLSWV